MANDDQLLRSLRDVQELEHFLRELLLHVTRQPTKPTHGADLTGYFKELKMSTPESLSGVEVTWDARPDLSDIDATSPPIVLVGPGRPDALGLTIGCIRIGRVKVCLECGWFYCRIVIKGRF